MERFRLAFLGERSRAPPQGIIVGHGQILELSYEINMTHDAINEKFLPFSLPDIGEEEIAEVCDTLRSGWLTTGPKTKRFEEDFARHIGAGVEALAVNSATAGLHLAAEACGIGPGDEVITTPYTFTATAEIVRYLGADPVFVDVLDDSLNIDPRLIEAAVTPRSKALIPVHFAGLACEMTSILSIAAKHQLKVIEDAAHALPATSAGKLIGSLDSDATVYSFYATKTLATGEGGMIVTRNPELARRCRIMRLHGIDRDAFDRYTSKTPAWFYSVVAPGFKYNMTDLAAAIGIHQLGKVTRFQSRREEMAHRYDEAFHGLGVRLPAHATAGDIHAWHLYTIRLNPDSPVTRDEFIEAMARAGVGTSVHFIPLHLHPYWRDTYSLKAEDFPVATRAYRSIVSLPLYTKMTDADQDRVIRAVRSILEGPHRNVVSLAATPTGSGCEMGS
jgi:dTDP-4-amino-4,6-dideoxygalactose transaminase